MTGRDIDERDNRNRRDTVNYKMFKEWYDFIEENPAPDKIVEKLFDFLDKKFFFRSLRNTESALKSLNLLLADKHRPPHEKSFDRNVFIIDMDPAAPGSLWPEGSSGEEVARYADNLEHALHVRFRGLQIARTDGEDMTEYGPYPVQGPDAKEIGKWVGERIESIIELEPMALRYYFKVELVGTASTPEMAWKDAVENFIEDPGPADIMATEHTAVCEEQHPDDYYEPLSAPMDMASGM